MDKQPSAKCVTMTGKEAAEFIGCSYWKLMEMTKKHEIPFISVGSRKLFRRESLDLWLENREAASVNDFSGVEQSLRNIR